MANTNDKNWLRIVSESLADMALANTQQSLLAQLADGIMRITGPATIEIALVTDPHGDIEPIICRQDDGTLITPYLVAQYRGFTQKTAQQDNETLLRSADEMLAGLPLRNAQSIGVVLVAFSAPVVLSSTQNEAATLLSRQAAAYLHQVSIAIEEQKKTSHLTLLNSISGIITAKQDSTTVVNHILMAVSETFKLDTLIVYSGSPMIVHFCVGDQCPSLERMLGPGLARTALEEGFALLSNDIAQDERCVQPEWASERMYAEVAAPLKIDGQLIGVMDAFSARPETFDMLDVQTFSTLARQLALVLRDQRTVDLAPRFDRDAGYGLATGEHTRGLLMGALESLANASEADHAVFYWIQDHILQIPVQWPGDSKPLAQVVDETEILSLAQEAQAFHKSLTAGRVQGLSWNQSSIRPNLPQGAHLAVPLGKAREEVAVLVLVYNRAVRFSAVQSAMLESMLALLTSQAQAIHHGEFLNLQMQQYALLYDVAANTHTLSSPLEVIIETAEKVRTAMHWQIVEIYQWDSANRRFSLLGKRHDNTYVRPNQDALFEQVRQTMEPVIWNPKGTRPIGQLYTHSAEMAVPLVQKGKLRGMIYVKGSAKQRFSDMDSSFLQAVANLLSDTLNNIATYAKLRQQLQEALTLNQIHKTIDYTTGSRAVLQRIVEIVFQTMHCYGAHIATLTNDLSALVVRAQTGFSRSSTLPQRYILRDSLLGRVAESQKPIALTDVRALSDSLYGIPEVQSMLAAPLINTNDETIGVLAVASDQNAAFSRTDEHLLNVAAGQISMVLENLQLYEDLESRSERLKQAYQQLQDLTELKDQILQNVSHELRTPLTMVKGYVELLVAEELGPLNEQQKDAMQTIIRRTDDLVTIIKQVVAVRPLGETDRTFTSVAVGKLLSDVVTYFDYRIQDPGITVHLQPVDEDLFFFGDEEKTRHIILNLLDNAVKFSPRGGRISVSAVGDGSHTHITISDQGIGIPDQQLNRIFETFYQVDGSSTRHFGGLGLGLTAVQRLINQQQGQVWVESEVGKGSIFHVLLPRPEVDSPSS